MNEPQHHVFDGLAALYASGALSEDERRDFEAHLEMCVDCVTEVKSLLPVTQNLLHVALPLDPPSQLRERVLQQVSGTSGSGASDERSMTGLDTDRGPVTDTVVNTGETRRPGALFWMAASLLIAVAGLGGWYTADLNRRMAGLQDELASARLQNERLEFEAAAATFEAMQHEEVFDIVTGPNVQQLFLTGQPLAPRATGRALWNDEADLVFLAGGLPALPVGDIYQLWFVTPDALISAALLGPDSDGAATLTLTIPNTVVMPTAMAITIEPEGGVPAPSGDVYLLGQPTN